MEPGKQTTKEAHCIDDNLLFRRQYFISDSEVDDFPAWQLSKIDNDNYLYAHPDLKVTTIELVNGKLYILGDFFHPDSEPYSPEPILAATNNTPLTPFATTQCFSKICGRYVVILKTDSEFCAFNDALSFRTLYFTTNTDSNIKIASDINLILHLLPDNKYVSFNSDAKQFYENEFKSDGGGNAWIGDKTIYKNINKLLPNKLLNINNRECLRYWPYKKIEQNSTYEVASIASDYIRKILISASKASKLSIAITAGYDSRIMAAASLPIKDSVHYFIDKHGYMDANHLDIVTGQKVANCLGVEFSINDQSKIETVPASFEKYYFQNTFYAGSKRLKTIYNYFQNYSEYHNILGISEIGRTRFGPVKYPLTPERLAYKYGYINSRYATAVAEKWLSEAKDLCFKYGVNPFTLFYWEQDLGNWGSVGNCESDIAFDEFNPLNCHYIYELLLSAPAKDTKNINNNLCENILRNLSPELAEIPVNPGVSFKGKIKNFLKREYIFTTLDYLRFILKSAIRKMS